MTHFDRREANLQKLKEADAIQCKTQVAIKRIQKQTAEAEEIGTQTLDELRRQGQQMVRILVLLFIRLYDHLHALLFFGSCRKMLTMNLIR